MHSNLVSKAEIRRKELEARRSLDSATCSSWSEAIVKRIRASEVCCEADTICSYVSMPSEVQIGRLAAAAVQGGKALLLPAFDPATRVYCWRAWDAVTPLRAGNWQIPEPDTEAFSIPQGRVCVLVPGLAFDRCGHRVGYGAGYYDRMLQTLRSGEAESVFAVGVAFACHLYDQVPFEAHDEAMDFLVTELDWIKIQEKGGC